MIYMNIGGLDDDFNPIFFMARTLGMSQLGITRDGS